MPEIQIIFVVISTVALIFSGGLGLACVFRSSLRDREITTTATVAAWVLLGVCIVIAWLASLYLRGRLATYDHPPTGIRICVTEHERREEFADYGGTIVPVLTGGRATSRRRTANLNGTR